MVLVLNPNANSASSPEVSTNTALKGVNLDFETVSGDYSESKMALCRAIMGSCIIDQSKYKNCISGSNACNWAEKEIAKPVVNFSCDLIRKWCGQDLDSTLNKLYEAGAITSSPDLTTKIDHRIKELNKLKHQVRTVASNAGATSHKAIEGKKPTSAPSEVAKKEDGEELEEEEATV